MFTKEISKTGGFYKCDKCKACSYEFALVLVNENEENKQICVSCFNELLEESLKRKKLKHPK